MKKNFHLHAGRYVLQPIYQNNLENILGVNQKISVAVVGATHDEIEYQLLKEMEVVERVEFFGISTEENYLDLNEDFSTKYRGLKYKYDLVICCQVLEHVWNHSIAIMNLANLIKDGGYIWCNTPSSNLKHGSPYYFFAGIQSETLEKLFSLFGVITIERGEVGSRRLYSMTHEQQYWPSFLVHQKPWLRGFENRRYLFPFKFLKYSMKSFRALFWSRKFERESQWATETFFFGKKLPTSFR